MLVLRIVRQLSAVAATVLLIGGVVALFSADWGLVLGAIVALFVVAIVGGFAHMTVRRNEALAVLRFMNQSHSQLLQFGDLERALDSSNHAVTVAARLLKSERSNGEMVLALSMVLLQNSVVRGLSGDLAGAKESIARSVALLNDKPLSSSHAAAMLKAAEEIQGVYSGVNPNQQYALMVYSEAMGGPTS